MTGRSFEMKNCKLLNWLAQKEKTLKEVALTDVAEEEDVKQSLKLLEVQISFYYIKINRVNGEVVY